MNIPSHSTPSQPPAQKAFQHSFSVLVGLVNERKTFSLGSTIICAFSIAFVVIVTITIVAVVGRQQTALKPNDKLSAGFFP